MSRMSDPAGALVNSDLKSKKRLFLSFVAKESGVVLSASFLSVSNIIDI